MPTHATWNPGTGQFDVYFDQDLVPSTKVPTNWHVYTPIWHHQARIVKVIGNRVNCLADRPNMWYGPIGISYLATPPDIQNLLFMPAAPFDFFPYW